MFRNYSFLIIISITLLGTTAKADKNDYFKRYRKCWSDKYEISLLDTIKSAMTKKEIEEQYRRHDFIQTFGCAYEEDEIEQNSIRAVYRAVLQSIRNRNVELRDDLITLLTANPPRPDNLMRQYSIYVNISTPSDTKAARYEIQILDLVAVSTVESPVAVWTRLVTRFAYKEDFNKIQNIVNNESEFVNLMENAQLILEYVEKRKLSKIKELIHLNKVADIYPVEIDELIFGDSMYLFDELNLQKTYIGIYLGKGVIVCDTPKDGLVLCKLGEERLFGIRIDTNSFRRTTNLFSELDYQASEVILQCLFLQFAERKPQILLPILGQ